MKISLFIPIYNARHLIERNLHAVREGLGALTRDFEVVFVDDNSSDGSSQVGRNIEQEYGPFVRYVHYSQGPSRRENLARSFAYPGRTSSPLSTPIYRSTSPISSALSKP